MRSNCQIQQSEITRTVFPSTHKGGDVMNYHFTQTYLYRWMLAVLVSGVLALPLLGSGILKERFISLAAVEDETDWTLARAIGVEEVDAHWILVKDEEKEDETDWTLASNDRTEENDSTEEDEVDWTLA
jgi:hypothetical protein